MADINLKTLTPDTSLPTTGFLFGADSQATASPSVYGVTTAITTILGNAASSDVLAFNSDTTFSRGAIRNFRFGEADAATAQAQTLSVQSVVAGTSNAAGAAFTITGSQGTGMGAGGSIVFQVAPAGGAGTAQNALIPFLEATSARVFNLYGTYTDASNYERLSLQYSASSDYTISVDEAGTGSYRSLTILTYGNATATFESDTVKLANNGRLAWTSSGTSRGSADTILVRDDANKLAQKNGTNAQEFRVYETTTGSIYKAILGNRQLIKISGASFDNGAGAQAGTMTNAPTAGNPTKWIPIDDNGTTRYIPAW